MFSLIDEAQAADARARGPSVQLDPSLRSLYSRKRYDAQSQLGQDLWAIAMTGGRSGGFFVDIGAYDGVDISNTWLLEKQLGWCGIAVEPNPILYEHLCINRTATCVQRAVFPGEERIVEFAPAGVLGTIIGFENTDHHAPDRSRFASEEARIRVETISPNILLERHQAPAFIDYLSIDTEGSEWDILTDLDYGRWRIGMFTVEHNHVEIPRRKIRAFLGERGYRCVGAGHDDWFYHPAILDALNGARLVDYDQVGESFARP